MKDRPETELARYRRVENLSWPEVAARLGISVHYARQLGCGTIERPSAKLAQRLDDLTDGEIDKTRLLFGRDAA